MDLSFERADSPSSVRGLTGPSRSHPQGRQGRSSALKPYERRSVVGDGVGQRDRTESLLSSSALSIKSAKSKADRSLIKNGGGVGLLSGLRQAIFSRPLSWLQGASSAKASASTAALPSYASPMLSAAQKLAASVKASNRPDDIETQATGITGKVKAPAPARMTSTLNATSVPQSSAFHYTPARSPSPVQSSASAAIRSHGRQRLSVGPPPQSPISGGSMLGTPGYRQGGSLRPDSGSVSGIGASQSSPAFAFGFGSERRLAGVSSAVSSHSHMPLSPLAPSTSYHPLPSRSPFAMKRQSLAESSAGGSVLGYDRSPRIGGLHMLATPSRSRPTSTFGGEYSRSRAGSVADSRMSTSSQTPKRREWSSLKMAPPKADLSAGEELMQAYLAMRNGVEIQDASAHPALQNGAGLPGPETDTLMMEFGAGPSSMHRHSELYGDTSLKRGVSMSIDGDEAMSEAGSRKRQKQMVWDAELGFVSKDDQRASRPPKSIPQNEAERLLNALEGLRAPAAGSSARLVSRGTTPSRQMMPVSVPLPVPERSDVYPAPRQRKVEDLSKTVSPYSRAIRSKLSQSVEPEERNGLKSKLRRPVEMGKPMEKKSLVVDSEETFDESMGRGDSDEENKSMASEAEAEEEEIVEPPRRKVILQSSDDKGEGKKTLRSGKVLPPSPAKRVYAPALSPFKLGSSSTSPNRPMSKARLEISASGTSAASRQKAVQQPTAEQATAPVQAQKGDSLFQVRSDATMERSRSSLRQGAEKTHRTHGKSGRVGLDDDEDDEVDDLPSAEELNKIKLPTNLFPQGFTFSGTLSPLLPSNGLPMSEASKEAIPTMEAPAVKALPAPSGDADKQTGKETVSKQSQESGPPGDSLLGRLGGFAPAPQTLSEANKPSMPSFSFTAPPAPSEKPAPASKPLFSFQPSNKTSTSDFFSAPASTEKQSSAPVLSVAPKDGPIPNFFASSLAKTDSKEEIKAAVAPLPFSFGKPAESKAPESNTAPASASSFSFGAPSSTGSSNRFSTTSQPAPFGQITDSKIAAPSFSFTAKTSDKETPAISFQGFGKPADVAKDGNQTAPVFGGLGAKPAEANSAPAPAAAAAPPPPPSISFGAAPADASKKRGAEDQNGGGPPKKSNGFTPPPAFAFNSSPAKFDGFSFGAPKSDKDSTSSASGFGSSLQSKPLMESTEAKAAQPSSTGGFAFGGTNAGKSEMMDTSPSSAQTGFSTPSTNVFGVASPTPASTKPAFSFGAPAVASSALSNPTAAPAASPSGFSFGGPSLAKPSSATPAAAPSFNFGAPASNTGSGNLFGQSSAPASNSFGVSTAPPSVPSAGGFGNGGFGSTSHVTDGSRRGSPAPFAFGAPASQPMTSGFSSGFGQNTGPAHSMAVSSPSAPTFAFGAPSAVSAPTTPGANNSTNFSFSMPAANGGASNPFGMPAEGGAPNQATPFIFGATSGTSTPPQQQSGAAGGFSFNMGASAPQSPSNSLFNMGSAPPPGSGDRRPMRSMPARRKR